MSKTIRNKAKERVELLKDRVELVRRLLRDSVEAYVKSLEERADNYEIKFKECRKAQELPEETPMVVSKVRKAIKLLREALDY